MALPRFNISSARNEQSYQVHVRALGFIRPLRNAKCQSEHSITLLTHFRLVFPDRASAHHYPTYRSGRRFPRNTFKVVLQIFGRRPLWRSGVIDICLQCQVRSSGGSTTRYLSTWVQDVEDISRETETPGLSGRVHIMGLGNAGTFIAHSLAARQSPPPITLLMHQASFYHAFRRKKRSLAVNYNGLDDNRTGFDVEVLHDNVWHRVPSKEEYLEAKENPDIIEDEEAVPEGEEHIECLVVCCKAYMTEKVIRGVRHRLSPDSTILFIQNGLGIIEKLNKEVFPDEKSRPHYMQGVLTHGLKKQDSYKIGHVNVGSLTLSPVATGKTPLIEAENDTHWAPTTKYLLRLLTLTPSLVATADTPAGLLQYQLERLAVGCVLSSLGAIHDCKNRELLYNFPVSRTMRLLLLEISSVICALPELRGIPGIEDRFSPERLRRLVLNVASNRPEDTSSIRNDLHYQRNTEIDFLNGWIVKRGEELGMKCVLNYMIQQLVQSRMYIINHREASAVPIDFDNVILAGDKGKDD